VIDDRKLTSADSVTTTVCPFDGLIVGNNSITLDLNGRSIRGSQNPAYVGIKIDNVNNEVVVKNGRILRFGTGLIIGTNATNVQVTGIQVYYNSGDGLLLKGDGNVVIDSPGRHNGNNGMTVDGNGNVISEGNNEYNGPRYYGERHRSQYHIRI
jgi:hypothetical protein